MDYPPATTPPLQFNFQSITQALGSHLNFDSQPSTVRVVISFQILIPPLGIQLSALRPLVRQHVPNRLESLSQSADQVQFLKHKSARPLSTLTCKQKALRSRNFPDIPTFFSLSLSPPPWSSLVPVPPLRSTCQYLGSSPGSTYLCKLGPSVSSLLVLQLHTTSSEIQPVQFSTLSNDQSIIPGSRIIEVCIHD